MSEISVEAIKTFLENQNKVVVNSSPTNNQSGARAPDEKGLNHHQPFSSKRLKGATLPKNQLGDSLQLKIDQLNQKDFKYLLGDFGKRTIMTNLHLLHSQHYRNNSRQKEQVIALLALSASMASVSLLFLAHQLRPSLFHTTYSATIPYITNQTHCEKGGRTWQDGQCIDFEIRPDF